MARLDVVIVNWNSGEFLRRCLRSVARSRGRVDLGRVVVVDNASTDGSCDDLPAEGLPLEVLRNGENLGFARACNQGAGDHPAELLLFLNPDAELTPGCLEAALRAFEAEWPAPVGIVGLRIVREDGGVEPSCSRFPTPSRLVWKATGLARLLPRTFHGPLMREWAHDETRFVDQVIGACFFVRGELFRALGGFDERFFVYYEEVDFSYRAREAGQRSLFVADASVLHVGGGSSRNVPALRLFYSWRSRLRFAHKHFSPLGTASVLAVTLLLEYPLRLVHGCARGSWTGVRDCTRALGKLLAALPSTLRAEGARR